MDRVVLTIRSREQINGADMEPVNYTQKLDAKRTADLTNPRIARRAGRRCFCFSVASSQ